MAAVDPTIPTEEIGAPPTSSGGGTVSGSPVAPRPVPKKPQKPGFTLKPSRQTCIGLAALTGVTLFCCAGLYAWQTQELSVLDAAAKAEQGKLESSERIRDRKARVMEEFQMQEGKLSKLETSVSENEYIPTLLKQVETLGKGVNLTVDSIRPTFEPSPIKKVEKKEGDASAPAPTPPPADAKPATGADGKPVAPRGEREWPYDKVHVDMQMRGSYWNIARLLYRLNDFPKIMAVEGIAMQPKDTRLKGTPQLSVTVRVTGFIFPTDGQPLLPAQMRPAGAATAATTVTPDGTATAKPTGTRAAAAAPPATTTMANGQVMPTPASQLPGAGAFSRTHSQQNEVMTGGKPVNDR